jgi:hypothetical protein
VAVVSSALDDCPLLEPIVPDDHHANGDTVDLVWKTNFLANQRLPHVDPQHDVFRVSSTLLIRIVADVNEAHVGMVEKLVY